MNFFAIISPLLALASVTYILKAIGLGNLMKPSNALAMATGGAGKIMGAPDLGAKISKGAGRVSPNAAAKGLRKRFAPDTRTGMAARAGAHGAKALGRGGVAALGAAKDYKNATEEERQAKRAALRAGLRDAAKPKHGFVPTKESLRGELAAATSLLANMGIFLAGPGGDMAKALRPLTFAGDRHALEAKKRESDRTLKAELKGKRGELARTQVAVDHYHALERSVGAANRGLDLAAGATFESLDTGAMKSRALEAARALGGANANDLFVDAFTGTVLTGVQATKIPNMGSAAATIAAARQQHHYFDDEFKKVRPGESDDEWTRRMTIAMVMKGGLDPDTGEFTDMLEKWGIRDNAEGRKLVLEAADSKKETPLMLDKEIKISASENAAINALMAQHQILEDRSQYARALKSRDAYAENVTPALSTMSTDNQRAVAQLQQISALSSGREMAEALSGFIDGPLGQLSAHVQELSVVMQGVKSFNAGEGTAALERRLLELNDRQADVLGDVVAKLADAQSSTGEDQTRKFRDLIQGLHREFLAQEHTMNNMASTLSSALDDSVKQHELIVHKAAAVAPARGQDVSGDATRPPELEL